MSINSPLVTSISSSRSTNNKPSGSWLLANNSNLAFSSFFTDIQPHQSIDIQPTKATTDDNEIKINKKINHNNSNSHHQNINNNNEKNTNKNIISINNNNNNNKGLLKNTVKKEKEENSPTFDSEFPVLLADSSPPPKTITPATPNDSYFIKSTKSEIKDSSIHQQKHVWSNTQMVKHKVLSPSKSSSNESDDDDDNHINNIEIERLKALVPKRRNQHQSLTSTHYLSNSNYHHKRSIPPPTSSLSTSLINNTNNKNRLSPSPSPSSPLTPTKSFTTKKSINNHYENNNNNQNSHHHNNSNKSNNNNSSELQLVYPDQLSFSPIGKQQQHKNQKGEDLLLISSPSINDNNKENINDNDSQIIKTPTKSSSSTKARNLTHQLYKEHQKELETKLKKANEEKETLMKALNKEKEKTSILKSWCEQATKLVEQLKDMDEDINDNIDIFKEYEAIITDLESEMKQDKNIQDEIDHLMNLIPEKMMEVEELKSFLNQ